MLVGARTPLRRAHHRDYAVVSSAGLDGTEFSPFPHVLGPAKAPRRTTSCPPAKDLPRSFRSVPSAHAAAAANRAKRLLRASPQIAPTRSTRVHIANVCHPKRKNRYHRQNAEPGNEPVHDSHV